MKQDNRSVNKIIKRYVDGIYTIKDLNALSNLRQNTESLSEAMDQCWEDSTQISTSAVEHEKYRNEAQLLLNKLKRKERGFRFISVYKYAAAITILLISGLSLFLLYTTIPNRQEEVVYSKIYVANGEKESLTLSDGTQITLNSGSYLRYPSRFSGNKRIIEINGEAFLQVHHDAEKQFIVRTQKVDVKVLGTSFNVKAYDEDEQVMVSVRTGKVQVDLPEASMNLKPDEMIILDKTSGELERRSIDSHKTTTWITGGLFFNKTNMETVAKELERCYNCNIEIENDALKKEVVYGEHSNESLESVLKAIAYAVGIKHRVEGDKIILYK
ncbi:MAG: FecR domain-containing protein [Massilibacteroides sp.]|nr:FecR domain-containing protein [Massilibacteroides sp.]MDD3063116.1 FecR domain-containing protein [Massilibacteroides sp.]MDD4115953.1 FecR domain-containing protein [Massilibacteroides sp.]MDD4661568.1 FecR domain-containing protein [Massilibacteroides sp.]